MRATVIVALGAWLLSACSSSRLPPPPVVAPSGKVYEAGTPPTETRRSQTATLYLRQDRAQRALELALEGIEADPANPIHYFLAGTANALLGRLADADAMFDDAERIYPAYELETEPQREAAWGLAFNSGLEAYAEGESERTIELWHGAAAIYDLRPEAHRNLGSLLALEGRPEEAIRVYEAALDGLRREPATRPLEASERGEREGQAGELRERLGLLLLSAERYADAVPLLRERVDRNPASVDARSDLARALTGANRVAEAGEIYEQLLSESQLGGTHLFNLGVALFRLEEYGRSADAFARLTDLQPRSRDAWFNYVNALFAAEAWSELAVAGGTLTDLEPLGENALLITARAHLESGDRDAAVAALAEVDAAPAFLDGLRMRRASGTTSVTGRVRAHSAPGAWLRVRFTFIDDTGISLGGETVELRVPEAGSEADFEVSFDAPAAAYHYEVVSTADGTGAPDS